MRPVRLLVLTLLLNCLAAEVPAETVIVPRAEPVVDLASLIVPSAGTKIDLPTRSLLLPLFEVNKNDPTAETTLFSVRNVSPAASTIIVTHYFTTQGVLQTSINHQLAASQTLSVNINDVKGLATDADGVARGYAFISIPVDDRTPGNGDGKGIGPPARPPALVGDYFQVIQNEDFASGDRLHTHENGLVVDLCQLVEARFLNGGAFSGGTDFVFVSFGPQGSDPVNDSPTMVATVIDEAGDVIESVNIFTDQVITRMSASELTAVPFGTLDVVFTGTTGMLSASYNALGRFSVGMGAACKDRLAGSN